MSYWMYVQVAVNSIPTTSERRQAMPVFRTACFGTGRVSLGIYPDRLRGLDKFDGGDTVADAITSVSHGLAEQVHGHSRRRYAVTFSSSYMRSALLSVLRMCSRR